MYEVCNTTFPHILSPTAPQQMIVGSERGYVYKLNIADGRSEIYNYSLHPIVQSPTNATYSSHNSLGVLLSRVKQLIAHLNKHLCFA